MAILFIVTPIVASAESGSVPTTSAANVPIVSTESGSESFRGRIQEQQKLLEGDGRAVSALVEKLKTLTESNVQSRVVEIRKLRGALVSMGSQLGPDAPLAKSVDQYSSWLTAQTARLNASRATLGPEFVEQLVKRYQTYLAEASRGREAIGNQSNAVDRTLKELTTAELRAGEMLMAEDAQAAAAQLTSVLSDIAKTIDDIRNNLKQLGTAGV
jgi:hypothetical protein